MKLADKLRNNGYGKPDFTKDSLMKVLVDKIKNGGYTTFIIGRHISTNLEENRVGDCNPNNRQMLVNWIREEGFSYNFGCNSYGVEHIKIYL